MKAIILAVAVLLALGGVAFADSTHTCQGNSCNDAGGASATAGASATGIGVGVGIGGGASVSNTFKPTNVNTNVGVNEQGQAQRQRQAQGQGQVQGQNNGQVISPDQSQSVSIDARTSFERYAPPVAAPALTSAGTGVCLGSVSIGLSGPMAGASFGITKVDKGCERRSGAALLYQMGYRDAALRLLMLDSEVHDAVLGVAKPVVLRTVEPEDHISVRTPDSVQGN